MTRTRSPIRRSLAALAAASLALAGALFGAAPAHAANFEVFTAADSGAGSLRQAIINANASPGADTITFQAGLVGPITITSGSIQIDEAVTITGPGASALEVQRTGAFDLFVINDPEIAPDPADVTIEGLTFVSDSSDGGGIVAFDGANDIRNLSLVNTVWAGFFTSDEGAAVAVYASTGSVIISGSIFDENAATLVGGAVYADNVAGSVSITDSVFTDNQSVDSDGGAVYTEDVGSVQISGTIFDENFALGSGGALFIDEVVGDSVIQTTNFINNTAGDNSSTTTWGGSIYVSYVDADATLTIRQSSILDSNLNAGADDAYGAGLYLGEVVGEVVIDSSTFARGVFLDSGNPTFGSGLSIGLCTIDLGGTLSVVNSTFDDDVTLDSFSIHACGIEDGGVLSVSYSTLVGPGNVTVETNDGEVFITSSILDASTFDSVFIDNESNPADVEWSLLSTALNTDYVTDGGGNRFSVADPLLGPLQNNGGPTPTRLLLPGSPALDTGNPAVSGQPSFDQRGTGFPRVNGRIDIGAIEMPRTLPATGSVNDGAVGLAAILLLVAGLGLVIQGRRALVRRGSR